MDALKQIGELCRQHYEKVILVLALLGLGFAAWLLYSKGETEQATIESYLTNMPTSKIKGVVPRDMSRTTAVQEKAANPPELRFAPPHNLFNPVKWQRRPDGSLIKIWKGDEVGVAQLKLSQTYPLKFRITLDKSSGAAGALPNAFYLTVADEASSRNPRLIRKKTYYVNTAENKKNELLSLQEVQGTAEEPELVLELVEKQERISVSRAKPYERVSAYEADLVYSVEGRTFNKVREGDEVRFGGEGYKIIAIKADEVVLSALLNDKKHTVKLSAGR